MTKIGKAKRRHLLALCEPDTGPVFDFRLIDAVSPLAGMMTEQLDRLAMEIAMGLLGVSP